MKVQDLILDRSFDAACLMVKGETEWSDQILKRLKANNKEYSDYIDEVFAFYVNAGTHNPDFINSRAEYMLNNKNNLKLRFK